ncbi:unnamed protein product [Effrenium voratum]|nr:unnamed protein product [Effrenium voratum]|mmetsp:Transcript_59817/g.142809  ORF Transcript_59817/g.142809 Transcript_59817/m.142809 type:complete len:610 (-) Transcript_59817:54-1883(-)
MLDLVSSYTGPFFTALYEVALVQELLVLATFALSFTLWRRLGRQAKQRKLDADRPDKNRLKARPKAPVRSFSPQEQEHAKSVEKQMQAFLAQYEFTRALNQYRSLERSGLEALLSEEVFASFVQSAVRVNKVDVAERMLRTMKRVGIVPSLQFWQHTMRLLSSRKNFALCLTAYSIFEHQIPIDKITFSCLINAALELNLPERTPALLQKFSQADLVAKDHVLHFRCFVALGNVDDGEALFRQLGLQVTTLMLNLLLLICVKKDPERAYRLLQEAHLKEKQMNDRLVDVVSYNTVMKGFGRTKSQGRCFDCMKSLVEHGLQPDDLTLGALLDACVAESDVAVANEIGDLLLSSGRQLSSVMCTLFIKGLVRAGSLSKAFALYRAMKDRECSFPDIIAYSVLIKGLVDQHELNKAVELLNDMKANGLAPDDIILTHLLEGCRHDCNLELGKKIYQDALASGVSPSDVTLVTLLKLLGRCGAHEEAFEVIKNWEAVHGRKPSVIHYTCLMSGCFRTKKYDKAWASFELMQQKGIEPDDTTIATMLPGMVASQDWDRVMILARKAFQRSAANLPVEALNQALAQMQGSAYEELKASMKRAGIRISSRNSGIR